MHDGDEEKDHPNDKGKRFLAHEIVTSSRARGSGNLGRIVPPPRKKKRTKSALLPPLTPEGGWHMVLRKDKVEIGNSE